MKKSDFLFYTNLDEIIEIPDVNALTRRLVSFASEFGLEGDIWKQWLTYMIMSDENVFSLACERLEVKSGSTLIEMAKGDMAKFRELMKMEPVPLLSDYTSPYEGNESTAAGKRIEALAKSLSEAETDDEFCDLITSSYEKYGTGIYGLYNAFRIDPGSCSDGVRLVPVTDSADVSFDDLIGYETQKQTLKENTEAFVNGRFANNVLLYGDSGTGKSTSVHALIHEYADRGLRLVEVSKTDRGRLSQILSQIKKRNYRFIIFLDDLSFEENESDYKELKAMLEGALETRSDRVLIYATSNRRHLVRETWNDRRDMEYEGDIHRSDTMEEKLSLAARFGVTIYYPKPDPRQYLEIVRSLAEREGIELTGKDLDDAARKWELRHGGMSGRTASQLITWLGGRPEETEY